MGLTWMLVAIGGCIGLALCIALVLLQPMNVERRRLRPIANASRLTRLPEYVRAKRAHTRSAVATIVLLVVMFACSIVVAARPTGLPTWTTRSDGGEPEDIMLCVGAAAADPATGAVLRYFADQADHFGTQRIGLTSPNRRVLPLTRDYQYAKQIFSGYARPDDRRADVPAFSPEISYADYAGTVEDLLALCLTGFPDFKQPAAQRRSLIYIGPGSLGTVGDPRPGLFTPEGVRDVARTAGVQVNALVTGPVPTALAALAGDTGGQAMPADANAAVQLAKIRAKAPAATLSDADDAADRSNDTPDVPLLVALLAAAVLALRSVVRRS